MNAELALVLFLLASAVVMFVFNRPRMDAVALLMMLVLPLTGVVSISEALAGFADSSVILIALLFVIGEGLARTGVAQTLGDWLTSQAGQSQTGLLVLLMASVGLLGSVISSTGVVAIFIPVALRIAQRTGIAPSQFMMPLSVAALISGMMTLVGTAPNLVVNSELTRSGAPGFSFFSFTPFGATILVFGIGYMLYARRWLSSAPTKAAFVPRQPSWNEWIKQYQLAGREHRLRIPPQSKWVGQTLRDLNLRAQCGFNLVAVERREHLARVITGVKASLQLHAGDILLVDTIRPDASLEELVQQGTVEVLPLSSDFFSDHTQELGMAEILVAESSELIRKTIPESQFRTRYGLTVVGLRRRGEARTQDLLEVPLELGDVLLTIGPWKQISQMREDPNRLVVLNLPSEVAEMLPAPGRALPAVGSLLLMVLLMISGLVPNVQAALLSCLLMGAFRCVDFDSAYRSIHWQSLILIIGMLPFSLALQRTGGVELAAGALTTLSSQTGPIVVLGCLFLVTAGLGLFISNTVTAVLMAPIALAIARDLNASPLPFAMTVALASSAAFMTPISSPVNTLVVGPGNYRFSDFVKVGVPFTLIVLVIVLTLVPQLLPLSP